MKADAISIVEAAYDWASDTRVWFRRLLETVAPKLGRGLGVSVSMYVPNMRPDEYLLETQGMTQGVVDALMAMTMAYPEIFHRTFTTPSLGLHGTCSATLGVTLEEARSWAPFVEHVHPVGVQDVVGVMSRDPSGQVIVFSAPSPDLRRPTRREVGAWSRIATHISAGARLRRAFPGAPSGDLSDGADAVLSPSGSVTHAEVEAQSPSVPRGSGRDTRTCAGEDARRGEDGVAQALILDAEALSHAVPAGDRRCCRGTLAARLSERNRAVSSRRAVSHPHGTRHASDMAMRTSCRAALVVAATALCACSSGSVSDRDTDASRASDASGASDSSDASADGSPEAASCGPGATVAPRAPSSHRASGSSCPSDRGPVSPDASMCTAPADSGLCTCATDSDCTAGPNGRCTRNIRPTLGGFATPADYAEGTSCSYDECFSDSQCADGGAPCTCRAAGILTEPNVCLPAGNCAVDSDCGPGGYCSPSALEGCSCWGPCAPDAGGGCSESIDGGPAVAVACVCSIPCSGYFCHTRCDQCVEDSDCQSGHCSYDTMSGRWECLQPACPS